MPTASQMVFAECGLTQWGREPDFVAPKPLSAREIRKLGDALDRAEYHRFDDDEASHVFHIAKLAYGQALAARNLYRRVRFENTKRVPTHLDAVRLRGEMLVAEYDIDELEDLGSAFSTQRELMEANSRYAQAMSFYEIAEQKYHSEQATARRRDRADRDSGVVRRPYSRRKQ